MQPWTGALKRPLLILVILGAAFPLLAGAATLSGKVTDTSNSQPVAGATVFVYWGHTAGPNQHGSYWWSCDGAKAAVTDAQGLYRISLPFTKSLIKTGDRAPQFRVVASGYYDDRIVKDRPFQGSSDQVLQSVPIRGHSAGEDPWSPSLLPLRNLDIDARLLALGIVTTEYSTGPQADDVCESSPDYAVYRAALARAFDDALCSNDAAGLPPPKAAGFQSAGLLFARPDLPETARRRYTVLYRELIQPLIPGDAQARISALALKNTCAWIRWQSNEVNEAPNADADPMALQVMVLDQNSDVPVTRIPARVLWGLRAENRPLGDSYTIVYHARRAFVTQTDDQGYVEIPVTRAMLDEQQLDYSQFLERPRFAVIPLTTDRLSFHSGPLGQSFQLDGFGLFERFQERVERMRPSNELERISSSEWEDLVNKGDASFSTIALSNLEAWRPGPAVQALLRLREAEEQQAVKASEPRPRNAIDTYAWQWPGIALLWRSSALLSAPVDVESDSQQWVELVRSQFAATFDQLCREPDQALTPQETWQSLQGLWWLETQSIGRHAADQNAHRRAANWDTGIRCRHRNRQETRRGPSPQNFKTRSLCSDWSALKRVSVGAQADPAPSLGDLKLDFSQREGTCPDEPDQGAFH